MALRATGAAIGQYATCDTICKLQYRYKYTPEVTYATLGGAPGMNLTIDGYGRARLAADFEVRINGTLAELKADSDDVLFERDNSFGAVESLVPDIPAGRYNISFNAQTDYTSWGAGFATTRKEVFQAEGGELYVVGC